MSQRRVCYINVSQTPMHRQARSLFAALLLLLAGSLAVGFRVYLCQAQAYAIIALTLAAACVFLVHSSQRKDSVVKIRRNVYCSDLSQTSQIAVVPGRISADVVSSYERLYFTRARIWLPLFVWLAWIAYGALFHSGQHAEHIVHELLIDVAAVGEQVPELVQRFRVYLLALCAFASLAATNVARFQRTAAAAASASAAAASVSDSSESTSREKETQAVVWVVFILSLFLPAIDSTGQALLPARLAARTAFFYVLFVLCESLDRLVHYERWLVAYRDPTRAVLVAMQIALGRAKPMTLRKSKVNDLSSQIEALSPPSPLVEPRHPHSADLLRSEAVKYTSVLQSAWLLVASESAYALAFAQVLLVLALHVHVRRRIVAHIRDKQHGYLCVNQDPHTVQQTAPILPLTSRISSDEQHVRSEPAPMPATSDPSSDEEPAQSQWPPPPTVLSPALASALAPAPAPAARRPSRSRTTEQPAQRQPLPPVPAPVPILPAQQTGPVRRKSASPQTRHTSLATTEPALTTTPTTPTTPTPLPKVLSEAEARRLALRLMAPHQDEPSAAVASSN